MEIKMNELIKQLMGKTLDDKFSHTWTTMTYEDLEKFSEQFAELIVKECVEIGDNYQEILGNEPECYNCRKVAYGIVDKIKEHFGVEE